MARFAQVKVSLVEFARISAGNDHILAGFWWTWINWVSLGEVNLGCYDFLDVNFRLFFAGLFSLLFAFELNWNIWMVCIKSGFFCTKLNYSSVPYICLMIPWNSERYAECLTLRWMTGAFTITHAVLLRSQMKNLFCSMSICFALHIRSFFCFSFTFLYQLNNL